jgi:uncharacterized membrane protein YdjX (TVP38/TMEM64 family)
MDYWILTISILVAFAIGFFVGRWRYRDEAVEAKRKWNKALRRAIPKKGSWAHKQGKRFMTN